jgi:hypothetical protein
MSIVALCIRIVVGDKFRSIAKGESLQNFLVPKQRSKVEAEFGRYGGD